jgi:tetratricopeptide (TPR) repeat protein
MTGTPQPVKTKSHKGIYLICGIVFLGLILGFMIRFSVFAKIQKEMIRSEASSAFDKGDYEKAIEKYKEIVDLDPSDPSPQYNLGVAYLANKQAGKARQQIGKLKKMKSPEYADVLEDLLNKSEK